MENIYTVLGILVVIGTYVICYYCGKSNGRKQEEHRQEARAIWKAWEREWLTMDGVLRVNYDHRGVFVWVRGSERVPAIPEEIDGVPISQFLESGPYRAQLLTETPTALL